MLKPPAPAPGAPVATRLHRCRPGALLNAPAVRLLAGGALVALLVGWADQPLARLVHAGAPALRSLRVLSCAPALPAGIALLRLGRAGRQPAGRREAFEVVAAVALGWLAETVARYALGRVPPGIWVWNQTAPLASFHPLSAGSLPSGHMTVLCALTGAARGGQRFRLLCAASALATSVGLLAAEAHYLSDLLAGGLCGLAAARAATARRKGG